MIFFDWETRSRCDLPAEGGWRYAAHETSEIVCGCAFDDETGTAYAWTPFDLPITDWRVPKDVLDALGWEDDVTYAPAESGVVLHSALEGHPGPFVAHNADGFDRLVWVELGLHDVPWMDSLHRARRRGLPGGLDNIAKQLYGLGKDKGGSAVMRRHMKPLKNGRYIPPNTSSVSEIAKYCFRDVLLLVCIWYDEGLGDPHPDDPVLAAHRAIDRRGVKVDLDQLRALQKADKLALDKAVEKAYQATDGRVSLRTLRSPLALGKWLAKRGYEVPDVKSSTVKRLLRG